MKSILRQKTQIRLLLPYALVAVLFFISVKSGAQNIRGEFISGFNMTQVDGDEVVGYRKIGFNGGAGAALPLGKNWYVSIETLLSQKGAYKKYPQNSTNLNLPYYDLRLNYAEIPLMIHYNDKDQITAGLGVSYGKLVGMKEVEHGSEIDWSTTTGPYNSDDYNIILDFRFRAIWKVYFNFRYAYSMSKIRVRDYDNGTNIWSRDQYNNLLSFRLVFMFNEKLQK